MPIEVTRSLFLASPDHKQARNKTHEECSVNRAAAGTGSCWTRISPMSSQTLPGLYIHIPFCRTKCPYCDFYSCADVQPVNGFIAALEKELLFYCKSFSTVDTVYFGGGTPTALPDDGLAVIMAAVHRHVAVAPDAEITIEANPNDVNRERLVHLRKLGFNRLSLGVQSFDDAVLRFLGRRHTADEARQSIKQAQQAGFDNISLDFMYGIPGEKQEDWFATLREALRFSPEHLSCYQLTIKEETPFFARVQEGSFQPCTEEKQAELFMTTSAFFQDRGYSHYEVSNFARAENLQARHNSKYWDHVPYLGLGPAAHSFDGRWRWWNVKSVEEYISRLLSCCKNDDRFLRVVIPACPESFSPQRKDSGQAGMTGKKASQKIQTKTTEYTVSAAQKNMDSSFRRNDKTGESFDVPREGSEELTDEQLQAEALLLGLRTRKGIALELALAFPQAAATLERLQADGLLTTARGRVIPTTRGLLLADHVALELYGNMP